MLCGAYLVRGTNPTWIANIMQSFCYVENCALAHLCYEQRLIDLGGKKAKNPDIGGQAFVVADPGPVQTYGDVYMALETMTDGECTFPNLPPTLMLIVAYMIEGYYLARHSMIRSRWGSDDSRVSIADSADMSRRKQRISSEWMPTSLQAVTLLRT